jgi:hypothetical protein
MKGLITIVFFIVIHWSSCSKAATNINNELLVTEASWTKELFQFPIPFAQSIQLEGLADVRFPQQWGNIKSPNFWSYVFAWRVSAQNVIPVTQLERYISDYFDGLMRAVRGKSSESIPLTSAVFIPVYERTSDVSYRGSVTVYDAFFTGKLLTLNVVIDQFLCVHSKQVVLIFRLSPKPQVDTIWKTLNKVELKAPTCPVT